ncbi:MAG: hypothetical protein QG670_26 [Thermoproteota archaeon]|nr:hypothetical protein [Thermoproteota archaeon]
MLDIYRRKTLRHFKSTKRKLKVGQPYGVQVFIDTIKDGIRVSELGNTGLKEIIDALKETFKELEEKDIYSLELEKVRRILLGEHQI